MEVVNGDDLKCIEETMISKRVLVVIDDVDEKLINDLSKIVVFQGKNKKNNVIVTCQNWGVLEGHLDQMEDLKCHILTKNKQRNFLYRMHFTIQNKWKRVFKTLLRRLWRHVPAFL